MFSATSPVFFRSFGVRASLITLLGLSAAHGAPLATVNVVSPDTSITANTVVTFGQIFSVGEVSNAQSVVATSSGSVALPTQIDVKRRHPDGSVRHAVLSVRLPAASVSSGRASAALTLTAITLPATEPAAVTLSDVTAGPVDYRVEIVEHGLKTDGSATAESGKTWTTTLKTALAGTVSPWLAGPLACEWRARVAPTTATLAHPGLRIIFDARYNSASSGRVSIAIENVEGTVARGDRTYDLHIYDATTGGTLVYSVDNLLHYAQSRHRKILFFGPGVKELITLDDTAALKRSRAIPNYADIVVPEATLNTYYTDWQASPRGLFQNSLIVAYMGQTGGRPDIGPLPNWTALAMISADARHYQIMLDQAERAAYFAIHYRDPATADIYSIDRRPTFSTYMRGGSDSPYPGADNSIDVADRLPPTALSSTTPDNWSPETAHQPSLAYVPYLVTGDRYFLDELYFWTDYNMISFLSGWRGNDQGWVADSQTRGQAWTLRTLGHAAWIAPESDWQKDYFTAKLNNNIAWFRSTVLTSNTLGFWWSDWKNWQNITPGALPNLSPQVAKTVGPWQHHFVAYTLYELCERGYAATDLRDFALGFSTKLFTSAPDYDPLDGTAYYLPAQLVDGTVMSSMAQMHYHGYYGRTAPPITPLDSADSTVGYAIEALMALSAAVDAGIPNAATGYRYVRNEIMKQGPTNQINFVKTPVWNIVPHSTVTGLNEAPGIYTVATTAATVTITSTAGTAATTGSLYNYIVKATGTPAPTFTLSTNPTGMTIDSGSGLITWTPSAAGKFTVTVNADNSVSPTASQTFSLTVATPTAPVITTQPASRIVDVGAQIFLSVAATGSPTPTFQWFRNGSPILGATYSDYFVSGISAGNAGAYTVVATNSLGSVTSATATISILGAPSNAIVSITVE
jgi:hypothetical protein